ncbi:MAG: insulinase family protein [Flavobacteriales bacterium]|nr:insulinase family protein [Flavobacteriales bacterium]MDW8432873.1 insulinase family protein [Flavobacteriales bacterium]
MDPAVRTGVLPNGLKYYILRNSKPEKRVEMRLAVNAGSCQEDDDQQGLAHFCEHMAFNGTRRFQKNELVNFLESVGTKFGPHLNAFTSFDETVYMLQVPTDSAGVVDKALEILADWAGGLAFDPEEVEKERGVVVEEWRLGQGAEERMRQKYWPVIFGGTRYGDRLPIGKKDILESFKHEVLRRFYRDWYRPDLMAVMVVGDVNPSDMEGKIKKHFSTLSKPSVPRRRESYKVPANDRLQVAVVRDPEAMFNAVQLIYMLEKKPFKTEADYKRKLTTDLINGMLNERLSDLAKKPESPYLFGFAGAFDFLRNNSAFFGVVVPKPGQDVLATEWLATELRRVQLHGFTQAELDRQKADLLKQAETEYNERDKRESDKLAMRLVGHFLQDQPFPAPEAEYEKKKRLLSELSMADVKALLPEYISRLAFPKIISMGAEKEGEIPPKEEDFRQAFEKALSSSPEPLSEVRVAESLLDQKPQKGAVRMTRTLPDTDIREFILANGARVYFKPTHFKNDQILFRAVSRGGTSIYEDQDLIHAEMVDAMMRESGLGPFDASTLEKMMKGKNLNLSFSVEKYYETLNGESAKGDIETLFQMVYLYFQNPRMDDNGVRLALEKEKTALALMVNNPEVVFNDSVNFLYHNRHPRYLRPIAEKLNSVNPERARAIMKERLANPGDFAFIIVGSLDEEICQDLVTTYIASLPASRQRENWVDRGDRPVKGKYSYILNKGLDPKSQVVFKIHGASEFSDESAWEAKAAASLMAIRLREVLREDKGGVYYVRCRTVVAPWPEPHFESEIEFSCDPQRVEELVSETRRVVREVKEKGTEASYLQKVRETLRRELETDQKTNEWWAGQLFRMALYQKPFFDFTAYNTWLDALTIKKLQEWSQKYFNDTHEALFVLKPEK